MSYAIVTTLRTLRDGSILGDCHAAFMWFLWFGRISEMKAKGLLRRGLGIATAATAMLVVAATPDSAGENTGFSYAGNGDGWANFVANGDIFYLNDTKVDGDAVWAELTWYKSGHGWHARTVRSYDGGANTESSKTKYTWKNNGNDINIPEGADVYVRACGSVKSGTYSNSGAGYHGVVYNCGSTKSGKA